MSKLTKLGYRIPLTEENESKCVKELVITAKTQNFVDYGKKPERVYNYRKSNKFLYVPRYYGISTYGPPNENGLGDNLKQINVSFNGELRPEQNDIITQTYSQFEKGINGGIWSVSTGCGKTITALYLIAKLGLKAIIIVNKEVLLRQWEREIKRFLPDARIGKIQSDTKDVDKKDIVIGMLQSLSKRNYSPNLFDDIGIMIVDETHNICSRNFSKVLYKIQSKYRIGLSATPKRKDGMETVMIQHLGPIIIEINKLTVDPKIQFLNIPTDDNVVEHIDKRGNINLSRLITDISKSKIRNQMITREVLKLLNQNRRIIVFSDRVMHCKFLNHVTTQMIKKYNLNKSSAIFIGGLKDEEYTHAKTCDVLFATYGLAKEGFDHPVLDTAVLATPKSDVVQIIGRILRQKNSNFPLVVDIVDNYKILKGMYYKRRRYYSSKQYKIIVDDNDNGDLDDLYNNINKCVILDDE